MKDKILTIDDIDLLVFDFDGVLTDNLVYTDQNGNEIVSCSRADGLVFENFLLEDWDFQLNVGLTGAMLCSQVFGQEMAKRGAGIILNIASDLSVFAPDQRLYKKDGLQPDQQPVKPVTYSVIKHGLIP